MRTIREMLGTDEKVWVYIDSRETWERFASKALAEGFHFGVLPFERWRSGYVIAVHKSGEMGHLPLFAWCMSFSGNCTGSPVKMDMRKYLDGEKDYICHVPHFSGMMV